MAVIFVTFIDILMPNNSMRKYTKLILGLLVMAVILNPVLRFIKNDFSLAEYSFKYQTRLDSMYIKEQSAEFSESQSRAVSQLYKKNLENQIGMQIRNEVGDKEIKVSVEIVEDTNSKNFGQIKSINVAIVDGIKAVEKVDKILIGPENEEMEKSEEKEDGAYEGLREKISSIYGVHKDSVRVSVE